MNSEPRVGSRIQRLRREKGLSQSQLAVTLGISPSYLNLIEHNRRRITVGLLLKLSHVFGVEAGTLAESDKSRLTSDLMDLFGDNMFVDIELTNYDVHDVAISNPKIGQAIMRLYDNYLALRKSSGNSDNILIDTGQDVATDAVSDFLQLNANHFPTLEASAERIRRDIDLTGDSFEYGMRTFLSNAFGLRWRISAISGGNKFQLDHQRGEIVTRDLLPMESAIFAVAQQLGNLAAHGEIDAILDESDLPQYALPLAREALASYFAAALVMPYEEFFRSCMKTRYDVEKICRTFKTSFEQACHRMTTLQRAGSAGIPLHLIRTDIAGNISKRFSLSGIHIPRHSGACPRWNVYSAFLHPHHLNVQISQMPEGDKYLCIAKSFTNGGYEYNSPRRHLSIGLGCHIAYASMLIYADGLDLNADGQSVPIGVGCRVCPRESCGERAHPALRPHR